MPNVFLAAFTDIAGRQYAVYHYFSLYILTSAEQSGVVFKNLLFSYMREYSMCVFAGGMWRCGGGGCRGLSESAVTPSLSSRFTASHLSPAPWPAACRQALANLTLLPLLPLFLFFFF